MVFKEADMPFPDDFTEEDKEEFKKLYEESKLIHPEVYEKEKWIFYYAIIMYIRTKHGRFNDCISNEELKELSKRYEEGVAKEVICKGDEIPYLYDKENNPIFKNDEDLKEYLKNNVNKD